MSGWLVVGSMLGSTLGLSLLLFLARRLADRFGTDEPSRVRSVIWLLLAVAAVASLRFVKNEWAAVGIVMLVTGWSLIGAALDERGGPLRRRLAELQLYSVMFAASYLYASGRGMLEGARASLSFSFALHDQITQLSLPLATRVLAFSSAADPTPAVSLAATSLTRHFVLWLALATFGFAMYGATYLSRRPLPLPGVDLVPFPRVASVCFAALALASALLPSTSPPGQLIGLAVIALCPLFVADGGALLHRWLSRLRARGLVLVMLGGAALLLPGLLFVLAALGAIAQLVGLRELLPFAALDEAPLKRPRLSSMLVVFGVSAACFAASTSAAHFSLRRVSPRLGSPTNVCGSVEPSVNWEIRSASFELSDAHFSMDLDETPLSAASENPAKLCERAGKRLCTSDEWYLACACTYPLEVEPGTKTSTTYAFVARSERERAAGPPAPREPTLAADKRSELRGLITGRSEIVAQGEAKGLLLAGPNDTLRDPWTVDCRHRSFLTPNALDSGLWGLAAVRCCR